ncbi:hypothetical protein QAD02_000160 [Eretmocerus hayati]|uniref:Uncharacterized protein n=1 Tax=Eretmocerus hayati TaxID=131215 RepID=A0ACC2NCU4_9HYME|nr:hypothetical protein QAD02_000160 [Eretmocerus hayati]
MAALDLPLITTEEIRGLVGDRVNVYLAGVDVLLAQHIRFVGVTRVDRSEVEIAALCLQNSDLHGNPHRLDFTVKFLPNSRKQFGVACSCKGGQGVCKHIVALLIYISRNKFADLKEATCTDVTQVWGKIKRSSESMYEAVSIKKFCHGAPDTKIQIRVREDVFPQANELIMKYAPGSELQKMREKRRSCVNVPVPENRCILMDIDTCKVILSAGMHAPFHDNYILFAEQGGNVLRPKCLMDLSAEQQNFYMNRVRVSLDDAVDICLDTVSQANARWEAERALRLTASAAYSFISPWNKSPHLVDWPTKVSKFFTYKFSDNTATQYGTIMEPRARDWYTKTTNKDVLLAGLMVNPAVPWLGYSPDGIVPQLNRIIEIKCPCKYKDLSLQEMVRALSFVDTSGENFSLKKKHNYYCQVQLGMFIANVPRCDFIIYSESENQCIIIPVDLDRDLVVSDYIPKLQTVYFKYMLPYLSNNAQ